MEEEEEEEEENEENEVLPLIVHISICKWICTLLHTHTRRMCRVYDIRCTPPGVVCVVSVPIPLVFFLPNCVARFDLFNGVAVEKVPRVMGAIAWSLRWSWW
jgi:hypothetical protein